MSGESPAEPFGELFGNPMLRGKIVEIQLPEPVSWWPETWGWQLVAVLLLCLALYRTYRAAQHWWGNRYRREALKQLCSLQQTAGGNPQQVAAALPALLKATALQAYPRNEVAALSGEPWLAFLDAHYNGPSFQQGPGRKLLTCAYQAPAQWQLDDGEAQSLIDLCRRWLKNHRLEPAAGRSQGA